MTLAQFHALRPGDILRSAAGKTWKVLVSEANHLEPSGRYVYVVRRNEQGGTEGLSAQQAACGVAIRKHTAKYTVVEGS